MLQWNLVCRCLLVSDVLATYLISIVFYRGLQSLDGQGLGTERPAELDKDDDEFDAYRKRMMLAYKFRPNPLVNTKFSCYSYVLVLKPAIHLKKCRKVYLFFGVSCSLSKIKFQKVYLERVKFLERNFHIWPLTLQSTLAWRTQPITRQWYISCRRTCCFNPTHCATRQHNWYNLSKRFLLCRYTCSKKTFRNWIAEIYFRK